jgi:hypothetical protein
MSRKSSLNTFFFKSLEGNYSLGGITVISPSAPTPISSSLQGIQLIVLFGVTIR